MGLGQKAAALRAVAPDLAVLSEVSKVPPAALGAKGWVWQGDYEPKGLAIASFDGPLRRIEGSTCTGSLSVAAEWSGLAVLAIWSRPSKTSSYGAEVTKALGDHEHWMKGRPGVMAGDFNLVVGQLEDARTGVMREVFERLNGWGYHSVYRLFRGINPGQEPDPTHYHQRRRDRPFHLDYCFVHESLLPRVSRFEVGSFDVWVASQGGARGLSDHVPILVAVEDEPTDAGIRALLRSRTAAQWDALWSAVDRATAKGTPLWTSGVGQEVGSVDQDGRSAPVRQMPHATYDDDVLDIVERLYDLGCVVPLDWFAWSERRPLDAAGSVEDVIRQLTALLRRDRFVEGHLASAVEDGSFFGLLAALRRWRL